MTHQEDRRRQLRHESGGKRRGGVVVLVILALAIGWGAYGHYRRDAQAQATMSDAARAVPTVRVAKAKTAPASVPLDLPGATEAFDLAAVNARATGYISERYVDIGSVVKSGDLLAVIAAPDLDQQLAQARAQLIQAQAATSQAQANVNTAKANYDLAAVTNTRFAKLADEGWATRQDADNYRLQMAARSADYTNAQAGVHVAEANQTAAQAAVDRLVQLTGYERVVAPFDGVITRRNVDIGDLVSADATGANGQNTMFVLSRGNVLRVRVDVPQSVADGIADGLPATVRVPEMPGREFHGSVSRTSVALAAGSRTLLAEIDVNNPELQLRPGLYVDVQMQVPRRQPSITVPAEALIFNAGGTQVATVSGGLVSLHKVDIRRDHGSYLELASGLDGGETVITNPFAGLADGQRVSVEGDGRQLAADPNSSRQADAPH